jgi:UDP-N-acetyl-D-mannosaminuronic acid dehydrogenase
VLAGGRFTVANDPTLVEQSRHLVVVIGTPVDEHLNPTFHVMKDFFRWLLPHLRNGQCLILRSTVFPGTTRKIHEMLVKSGKALELAFCPERVAEGKAMKELIELPQLVSGCSPGAVRTAAELFGHIGCPILELSPEEAEIVKVFTNAWRYIQFATANQFFMIATDRGLDFYRIHDALTRDYPRMAGLPRSGFAAGPCLFKDTMQLAAVIEHRFALGHAAMLINEGLPEFVVKHLKRRYPLSEMTVGILGMAFKGDSDDPRESLSYKLRKILDYEAGGVLCTDPFVANPDFLPAEKVVARSDALILGAPHSCYRSLAIPQDKVVIDIWNFFGRGANLT